MKFRTIDYWDEELWNKVSAIYFEAFGTPGKEEDIIRNMFTKNIGFLHVLEEGSAVVAMALTGRIHGTHMLLIDYIAISIAYRKKGLGQLLMEHIHAWCLQGDEFNSMLIEVEAEETEENVSRIRFWERCGFTLTDYVHQYIWVPEPYRAMYQRLVPDADVPEDGAQLFGYISKFHGASYRGAR